MSNSINNQINFTRALEQAQGQEGYEGAVLDEYGNPDQPSANQETILFAQAGAYQAVDGHLTNVPSRSRDASTVTMGEAVGVSDVEELLKEADGSSEPEDTQIKAGDDLYTPMRYAADISSEIKEII